jgi:NAD(P)-dependent dehydrogenase (short-subunit alcohol dehydrogenase family)
MSDEFATRTTVPARALPFRLIGSVWRQRSRSVRCPDGPRLDGKRALVTGGNAGIGIEIARGLARRGAEVVIAARNAKTAAAAIDSIVKETGARVRHVPLDLSDLASVRSATDALGDAGTIDVLVCNAGLWPQSHALSAQGHELAFATNTLGHHVLVRRLLEGKKLAPAARVVVVTGDIYVRARECTSDFVYEGRGGGALAYSRSKLGNLWFGFELQRRYPSLEVCVVHPGVIASGLGGEERPPGFFRDRVMLDLQGGAQAPLWCATQPIEKGAYYHNTLGRMALRAPDPAADPKAAEAMWARLEELGAAFL